MWGARSGLEHGQAFIRATPLDDFERHLTHPPTVDITVAGVKQIHFILPDHCRAVVVNHIDFPRLDDAELGPQWNARPIRRSAIDRA